MEFPFSTFVVPAPLTCRPLDELAKPPYPYGCSRLCNHPVDAELRKEYREVLLRKPTPVSSRAK